MTNMEVNNQTQPPVPLLDSPERFAELVGVSAFTVRKLCRNGKLPALKIGSSWRINRTAALEALGIE